MNILKINIIIVFLGVGLLSYGQQQSHFSNYHQYNPYRVNAAASGLLKSPEIFAGTAVTAMKIDGHPTTFYLSGVLPFKDRNFALGVSYLGDKIGVVSDNLLKISYAYRLDFDDSYRSYYRDSDSRMHEHSLSLGIDAGLRFFQDDLTSLGMTEDPTLSQNHSVTKPVFGASAMYNHPNFFIGVSVDNLVKTKNLSGEDEVNIEEEKPLYFYGGYRLWMFNDSFLLTPNVLVRHDFENSTIVNYNLKMDYNDVLEAGVGYIDYGAVNLSFGVKLFEKRFHLLYATNLYTKSNFYSSSHGIMLKYEFASYR